MLHGSLLECCGLPAACGLSRRLVLLVLLRPPLHGRAPICGNPGRNLGSGVSRKHFAKDCEEPLKCWRCYKDFHLASQCPGPSSKLSSTVPSHGPRLGVGDRLDAPASHASMQRSYAEALLAPPLGDRLAHSVDGCVFPLTTVEQDLLAAMLSARPVGIDPHHSDPMLDEALTPTPQVLHAAIGPVGYYVQGDDVW